MYSVYPTDFLFQLFLYWIVFISLYSLTTQEHPWHQSPEEVAHFKWASVSLEQYSNLDGVVRKYYVPFYTLTSPCALTFLTDPAVHYNASYLSPISLHYKNVLLEEQVATLYRFKPLIIGPQGRYAPILSTWLDCWAVFLVQIPPWQKFRDIKILQKKSFPLSQP